MSRRNREFSKSLENIAATNNFYFDRLTEIALSVFQWENLPESIDARYLEVVLNFKTMAIFFQDEALGLLALPASRSGRPDIYDNPTRRIAIANNGYYRAGLTPADSVICFNNMLRTPSEPALRMYANKLAELDRTIFANVRAQKTPILIQADEDQRLTLKNVYAQYSGDYPVIYASKKLGLDSLTVLKTDAPYLVDKLTEEKEKIWAEALTYLGITNLQQTKKERLITDEVRQSQGGSIASRYSRLFAREQAVEKINKMFGTNIEVKYREGISDLYTADGEPAEPEESEESEVQVSE